MCSVPRTFGHDCTCRYQTSRMELDWSHNEERQRSTALQFWNGEQNGGEDQVDQKQHGMVEDERRTAG